MYNVQLDEKMFFTGSYAKKGTVNNGINVESLPPTENSLCYKLVDVDITKTRKVPVRQYMQIVKSDTESNTVYNVKSIDELGNEIFTPITEEEYEALSAEEKENVDIIQIPIYNTVELSEDEYKALSDEEQMSVMISYKTDENGEVVYDTIEYIETVKDWEFSQERYNELELLRLQREKEAEEAEKLALSMSNETLKAENQMLTEQLDILTMCVLEMSEMVYA